MSMKRCSHCKVEKPLDDFHNHSKARDGKQAYCKVCTLAYMREYEAIHAERIRAKREAALAEPVDLNKTKVCPGCSTEKPLLEFYAHRSTRDRRATYCKTCAREYDRTVRGDKKRAATKKWAEKNAVRYRRNMRKFRLKLYGLTEETFNTMLEVQGHRCAICGGEGDETADNRPRLVVDHCHETNRVRALLCNGCNCALGMTKDDPARLRAAADYLERHRALT